VKIDLSIDPEEVTTIITDFIKNYVANAGTNRVVLGFSGGVDSAVAAVLCKKALGKKHTLCLFMPDETTPPKDREHHILICKTLGLESKQVEIGPISHEISRLCVQKPDRLALANIKARERMILLYEYANMTNSLVSGTSNKSELLIGYFTKYGDGGVDFQPLGDVYKTQVYMLARFLKIPDVVVHKPPTAGLWMNQTDEEELGLSYETLDIILYGLELKLEPAEIVAAARVKPSEVERIRNMRKTSQHKRRSPLIPKIGVRTPGLDWRSPVMEG
jgi:NAD+ synthase